MPIRPGQAKGPSVSSGTGGGGSSGLPGSPDRVVVTAPVTGDFTAGPYWATVGGVHYWGLSAVPTNPHEIIGSVAGTWKALLQNSNASVLSYTEYELRGYQAAIKMSVYTGGTRVWEMIGGPGYWDLKYNSNSVLNFDRTTGAMTLDQVGTLYNTPGGVLHIANDGSTNYVRSFSRVVVGPTGTPYLWNYGPFRSGYNALTGNDALEIHVGLTAGTAVKRWGLGKSSDADPVFYLNAYTNTGVLIDRVFQIVNAASGTFTVSRPSTFAGGSITVNTPAASPGNAQVSVNVLTGTGDAIFLWSTPTRTWYGGIDLSDNNNLVFGSGAFASSNYLAFSALSSERQVSFFGTPVATKQFYMYTSASAISPERLFDFEVAGGANGRLRLYNSGVGDAAFQIYSSFANPYMTWTDSAGSYTMGKAVGSGFFKLVSGTNLAADGIWEWDPPSGHFSIMALESLYLRSSVNGGTGYIYLNNYYTSAGSSTHVIINGGAGDYILEFGSSVWAVQWAGATNEAIMSTPGSLTIIANLFLQFECPTGEVSFGTQGGTYGGDPTVFSVKVGALVTVPSNPTVDGEWKFWVQEDAGGNCTFEVRFVDSTSTVRSGSIALV